MCCFQTKEKISCSIDVDDPITFLQLSSQRGTDFGSENVFESSLTQAVGGSGQNTNPSELLLSASKLNKVTQLTGFSDPVYAEAYVHVNQYDIVLDVLIVNQTGVKNVYIYFLSFRFFYLNFNGRFPVT